MTTEKTDDLAMETDCGQIIFGVNNNDNDPTITLEKEEEDNLNDVRYQNSNISLKNSTDMLDNQSQSASQSSIELNNKTIALTTKRNQPDDDLTSLTWLHQQNLLKGLELPAKVSKNGETTTNNNNDNNNNSNNNKNDDDNKDNDNDNNNNNDNSNDDNDKNSCEKSSEFPGKSNFIITPADESCYSGSKTDGLSQKKNKNHSAAMKNHRNQMQIDQRMEKNSLPPSNRMKISLNYNNNNNMPIANRNKHPTHIPYDPYLHRNSKPPYSFSCLIFMAIEDSPIKALPVKEVYAWILDHFPYFRTAQAGWKNSVRHNLSLNKCFRKVDKAPNMGKGSLWKVDNQHRSNLLQALARAPFPRPTTQNSSSHDVTYKKNNATRLPDPVLFPYLFKKLASNDICSQDFEFDSDVDAAAVAMLSFRHGPIILNHDKHRRPRHEQEKLVPVITRSSNEDHTYSCITSGVEKFNSKSLETSRVEEKTVDELRKVADGADALLNLASIALSHNNNNNNNDNNNNINLRFNHEQSTATNISSSQLALPTKSAAPNKKSKRRMISKIYMNLPDVKRNKHWPSWRNSNRYLKQVKS